MCSLEHWTWVFRVGYNVESPSRACQADHSAMSITMSGAASRLSTQICFQTLRITHISPECSWTPALHARVATFFQPTNHVFGGCCSSFPKSFLSLVDHGSMSSVSSLSKQVKLGTPKEALSICPLKSPQGRVCFGAWCFFFPRFTVS